MGSASGAALVLAAITIGCGGSQSASSGAGASERGASDDVAASSADGEPTEIGVATDLEASESIDSAVETTTEGEAGRATEATGAAASSPEPEPPAPRRMASPPFQLSAGPPPPAAQRVQLLRVSSARNQITDVDRWRQQNGLGAQSWFGRDLGQASPPPSHFPSEYAGHRLTRITPSGEATVLTYGQRVVAVADADGAITHGFDFETWAQPPSGPVGQYTDMEPGYAQVDDGVLYVSHYHRTYARASGGRNAYLSAIDLETGRLLWRSQPLVQNARTFVLGERVIVAAYGFTDEKDYLYAIDRNTGRVVARDRLEAGARFLVERGGDIFIRAYDRDYVYRVRVTP